MTIGKKMGRQGSNIPGGLTRDRPPGIPSRGPGFRERVSIRKRGAYNKKYPLVARDGVCLSGAQLYKEIMRDGDPVKLAELDQKERDFLESVEDQMQAYAEVRRRWQGSTRQARWLGFIYRIVVLGEPV